jgi:alkanesulfonate monooxygenase SsuD/methylene tetrahydromethanopterin reductase-like flavin-dependent oxidoreductase (luciferase family)
MTDPTLTDRPFKLGFLTHVHGPGRPAADVYRDLIETFTAAEALGFDGGWVAQHHLRDDFGRLPSPHVLLAAVAAVTSRIELGTAVTVLPLEDPLRLAEDAAVLDALSGGRVQLGLGSGGANAEARTAISSSTRPSRLFGARWRVHPCWRPTAVRGAHPRRDSSPPRRRWPRGCGSRRRTISGPAEWPSWGTASFWGPR